MFRRLSEPLPLSEASILLFRPALNAPVLNVGYLPIGPARAAVVAFGEEYGGIGIALGVRASESGQLVVLRNQESIDFDVPLDQALEPLLAEAERMGFLFDEDVLEETPGQAGRARAMAHWADLMGGMESLLPPRTPDRDRDLEDEDGPVGPLSPSQAIEEMQYPELMLDDVAPLELEDEPDSTIGLDATETLEPDLEVAPEAVPAPALARPRLDEDLDEPLEHGLDEALADAFEDSLGDELGDELDDTLEEDADWSLEDGVLGESDLTEPTAPIAAAPIRVAPSPALPPRPAPAPRTAPIQRPAPVAAPTASAPASAPLAPASAASPGVAPSSRPIVPSPGSVRPTPPPTPMPEPDVVVARPAPPPPVVPPSAPAVVVPPAVAPVAAVVPKVAAEAPPAEPGPSAVAPSPVAVSIKPAAGPPPATTRAAVPVERTAAEVRPPRVVLSKFRNPDGLRGGARPGASEVGADRSSELARIPIVRVRRERDPSKRVPLLARLLSSF